MVFHSCNPHTWKAEAEGSWVERQDLTHAIPDFPIGKISDCFFLFRWTVFKNKRHSNYSPTKNKKKKDYDLLNIYYVPGFPYLFYKLLSVVTEF